MTVSTICVYYSLKYACHRFVCGVDQSLRMLQRNSIRFPTAHDTGNLLCALVRLQTDRVGARMLARFFFINLILLVCVGGNLRQVGNGNYLHILSHFAHNRAHFIGNLAGSSGVYLIENDGR